MPSRSLPATFNDPSRFRGKADILLWPEGAIQDDNVLDAERIAQIEGFAREANVLVAIGWYRNRPTFTANSIVVAHPRHGLIDVYEKTYLVPWTEFRPSIGIPIIPTPDRAYRSGSRYRTFVCAGARVAPAICYDACFPGLFRRFDLADVFMVCSSEGADQSRQMSAHILQMIRLRAIEFRRPIVRNVRDGHSGIVDSCGRVVADLVDLQQPTVVGPGPLDSRTSIYSLIGDWILVVPALSATFVCYYRARRSRRSNTPAEAHRISSFQM
jgi:apolipoprotein N-acyltransferase